MEQLGGILFFLAIAGGLGALIVYGLHLEKKRREALAQLFAKLGFAYQPSGVSVSDLPFGTSQMHIGDLPLFTRGSSRRVKNYAEAKVGAYTLCYFDYTFVTGSNKNRKSSHFSVVGLGGSIGLPKFTLGPEDFFSKIAQAVGYDDIDLPSDPEFSQAFVLRSPEPEQTARVLTRPVLDTLKRIGEIQLEAGPQGIIWIKRITPELDELAPWLEQARGLFAQFTASR
jgi:hypothetical protein